MHPFALWAYIGTTFLVTLVSRIARHVVPDSREQARKLLEVSGKVATFYGIGVAFTLVNGWLYKEWHGGFPFPMLNTGLKMWFQYGVARCVVQAIGRRPAHKLAPGLFWVGAVPVGMLASADILLSNMSLKFVDVSFYTIAKSGNLAMVLLWAVVLGIEAPKFGVMFSVATICVGLGVACWGEATFSSIGLALVLGSSCLAGLRWALTQRLGMLDPSFTDSLNIVHHVALPAAVAMLPAMAFELRPFLLSEFARSGALLGQAVGMSLVGGCLSFALLLVEVELIQVTSSLTMAVFGSVREMIQIGLAIVTLGDQVSALNVLGLAVAMAGTWSYKLAKAHKRRAPPDSTYAPIATVELP